MIWWFIVFFIASGIGLGAMWFALGQLFYYEHKAWKQASSLFIVPFMALWLGLMAFAMGLLSMGL